jgi:hypothetical protein
MIKKILILLAVLVVVLIVIIATRPATFSVSRSAVIAAPPAVVFAQVNDFRKWDAWSPWAKLDPNSSVTFEGPGAGTGSIMKWSGNKEVGEGRQEIVESQAGKLVLIRLDFVKPFVSTSDTVFRFEPSGSGTLVTWTMSGNNNFTGKAISLVMDCEKMIGPQFETGLASLKRVSEVSGNF